MSTAPFPSLEPNLNAAAPPAFHTMDADRFEEMSCALLDKEPGINLAELYGRRFDKQFGIDCFGDAVGALEVVSCKCYAALKKGELSRWSTDFLDHWQSVWKDRKVTRFILSTAAEINSTERMAEVETERERFSALGVAYEVWAPRQLQEKLRPHRGLVHQFIGPDWVSRLCGEPPGSATRADALVQRLLEARVETLGHALGVGAEGQVDQARLHIQQGRSQEAARLLDNVRSGAGWPDLPTQLRAQTLRLQATLALSYDDDLEAARRLGLEADALCAPEDARLPAQIALREAGPFEALKVLGRPATELGRTLEAALQIMTSDLAVARATLASLAETPERWRLQAHLELEAGDRSAATAAAAKAVKLAPDNLTALRTQAIVQYAQTLSPLVRPRLYTSPQPLAAALYREEDAARAALRQASEIFDDLIGRAPAGKANSDRLWRLACLCNLPDRRADASQEAIEILAASPMDPIAIGWSGARALDVDLAPSRRALDDALEGGTLDVNGPRALDWLTPTADQEALLKRGELALRKGGWPADVADEISALVDRLRGREAASESEVLEGGPAELETDVASLSAQFVRLCEEDPRSPLLLGAAELLAREGAWSTLAGRTDCISAFGTAEATRLAAYAALNTGDPLEVLRLLEAGQSMFQGQRLPSDLRRLQAEALSRQGEAAEAVSAASALSGETRSPDDAAIDVNLRFRVGDIGGAAQVIRSMMRTQRPAPEQALGWASVVAAEDLELARQLWRLAADASAANDEFAVRVLNLAFELGLESERPELFAAMNRMAQEGRGGVQIMDLDGAIALIKETRERVTNISDMVGRSEIPIHLAIGPTRANLADILWLEKGREEAVRPMHIRNGARPAEPIDQLAECVLIDPTSLLLGDQLGLIELLRASGRELWVAPSTAAALVSIEDGLKHPQPRRSEMARQILNEVGGRIRLVAPAASARVELEADAGALGVAQVIAALAAGCLIGASEATEALRRLNRPKAEPSAELIRNRAVVFGGQTLESLTEAGLLDATLAFFDAFIAAEALEAVRTETDQAARRATLTGWIQGVRERLSDGIIAGTVHVLPMLENAETDDWPAEPVSRALREELGAGASWQSDLWIDDRMVSGYPSAGAARIVGISDILAALRTGGQLSEERYFECLARLRAAGALFLPIADEELGRALARARIVDGELQETRAMSALRRNASLAMLRQDALREVTGSPEDRPTELTYLIALRRTAEAAIIGCWSEDVAAEIAEARSSWIWASLRAERALKPTAAAAGRAPEICVALNLAGLVSGLLRIGAGGGQSAWDRRASFLDWVSRVAVGTRLADDPELSRMFGDLTRALLRLDLADVEGLDDEFRAQVRAMTRVVVAQLPAELQAIVLEDDGFFRDIGLDRGLVLTLGDSRFDAHDFWAAAREVLGGGTGSVEALENGGALYLTRRDDGALQLSGALDGVLPEPALGLLADDPQVARSAAADYLRAIDTPQDRLEERTDALMRIAEPHLRIREAHRLSERSIPVFLSTLENQVETQAPVSLAHLRPPTFQLWLDLLRWPAGSVDADSAQAACAAELGAAAAAERFSGLPISLAPALGAELVLDPPPLTVLGLIHRLHALRTTGDGVALAQGAAQAIDACREHGEMFTALLGFGAVAFSTQPGWPQLPPPQKHAVVWTYAEQVAATLLALNVDPAVVAVHLRTSRPPLNSARMLTLEHGYDDDPLHAMCVSPPAVLLAGLEYALGPATETVTLDGEAADRLIQVLARRLDDGRLVPQPLRTTAFVQPALATWMTRTAPDAVIPGGGQAENWLAEVVEALEHDPADAVNWRFLRAVGPPQLEPELRARLSRVADVVDLAQIADRSDTPLLTIRDVGEVLARLCDVADRDRLLNQLFMLSDRWLADPQPTDAAHARTQLLEAAASLSKSFDVTGPQRLSQFLRALVARWPDIAEPTAQVLARLVESTPVAEADAFQEAWLAARAV